MTDLDRRQILKGGGAALTLGLAGCLSDGRGVPGRSPPVEEDGGDDGSPSGPGFQAQVDEHLADTSNYDGTVEDMTGQGSVDVTNGDVEGVEDQPFAFGPSAIQVDPGTTVTWTWSGSTGHSVTHDNGDAFNSEIQSGDGTTFEYTFDDPGLYLYICIPHESLGQKGAVVVGDMGGDTGQEPSNGGTQFQADIDEHLSDTGNYDGTIADFTGEDTVDVTNGDVEGVEQAFAFGPPAVEIETGTTVRWTWSGSDSHSVTHDNGDAFNSEIQSGDGTTFEYTFDEPGLYLYVCIPHQSLGQKGAVAVRDSGGGGDGGSGDDGGDGGGVPEEVSDHLSDVGNFDGTVADFTGEDTVGVTSGDVEGVDQQFAFGPAAIRVDSGTEVTWTWSGSDSHSVTHDNGGAFDSGIESGDGTTFSYTFDEPGVYLYICIPHQALGQKGAVIVE